MTSEQDNQTAINTPEEKPATLSGDKKDKTPSDSDETLNQLDRIESHYGHHSTSNNTWGEDRNTHGIVNLEQVQSEVDRLNLEISRSRNKDAEKGTDFSLEHFLRESQLRNKEHIKGDVSNVKKAGVVYKHVTVKGIEVGAVHVKTFLDAVWKTVSGQEILGFIAAVVPPLKKAMMSKIPVRNILHDFSGVVREGEMLLVLGKPGSGCSTFLHTIANDRDSYAAVEGEVHYSGIPAGKVAKLYRGEVVYNAEDDVHFPTLTVEQTLSFALMNKTKKRAKQEIGIFLEAFGKMFGISHTFKTLVGNEFVHGVSGGEMKRVSIAESLAAQSTVVCWDQATRGLDASTAVDYVRSMRIMTNIAQKTTLFSLYQAGEGIYELVDKVLVIYSGRMAWNGPAKLAKQYFIDLGYYCGPRTTTADFLTAVTDPNERVVREGFEKTAPQTPEEFEERFKSSQHYQALLDEIEDYEKELESSGHEINKEFETTVRNQKSNSFWVPKKSNYTVSFPRQVWACTKRQFWLLQGDISAYYIKSFVNVANAFIVASLFYNSSNDTAGAFSLGGVALFSILFNGWLQLGETFTAVLGRNVLARHKMYALYSPSAVVISRAISDIPIILLQNLLFSFVTYFMTGLQRSAGHYFYYLLVVFLATFCLTQLYRLLAAISPSFNEAIRYAGIYFLLAMTYAGYIISKTQLFEVSPWFGWIFYVSPLSYCFESVIINEFGDRDIPCAPGMIVPPGGDPAFQTCAFKGSRIGTTNVRGADYVSDAFGFSYANKGSNIGVILAYTALYLILTMLVSEYTLWSGTNAGVTMFARGKDRDVIKSSTDGEGNANDINDLEKNGSSSESSLQKKQVTHIEKSKQTFTWKGVTYTIPFGPGIKLLNSVDGYCKPGQMTALMGASGAGKTTLLNTLSQRTFFGKVEGSFLVDGKPLGLEFQRQTGFVEQAGIFEIWHTVREALEMSARLRQEADVSDKEKLAYVDVIIDLLELKPLAKAVIVSLSLEQKKRVTIGMELASKPGLLLFLDEPTSGLDSVSAFNIVRFMRRLADAGQSILCTIHQPSQELIQQFDRVLALNPGGNVFYNGPVGREGRNIFKYFNGYGARSYKGQNVAEFLLDVGAGNIKASDADINWNDAWRDSPEHKKLLQEIEDIGKEGSSKDDSNIAHLSYAASTWMQTKELTKRTWKSYYRDAAYGYSKIYASFLGGLFNGFTFYMLQNSYLNLQERMFSAFFILIMTPSILNSTIPKFLMNRAIWEFREKPARIYDWIAFCTANIVCEIPFALLNGLVYWLLWYWPVGNPAGEGAIYAFLMIILYNLFTASWAQWMSAFSPSPTILQNTIPFFLIMTQLFTGIIQPYSLMPVIWRYTIYYISPFTYFLGGLIVNSIAGVEVICDQSDLVFFNPPQGQTCGAYASSLLTNAPGSLTNPDATEQCGYCQLRSGDQYLESLNLRSDWKWPYLGIFCLFVVTNYLMVYAMIFFVRVKGWSFGLGFIFGLPMMLIGYIKSAIIKKK